MFDLLTTAAAAAQGLGSPADIWGHIVADFSNITSPSQLKAFGAVLMIDIMLAGDNAIVVGALAAGLPAAQRKKVILIGIIAALVLRIAFALVVSQLMQIVGLILAGGLLLLWVSFKMWRELHPKRGLDTPDDSSDDDISGLRPAKSFAAAAWAVAVADVSMSLDNVLAVAGAAKDHPGILIIGLILSVALMGVAANIIAKYIERFRWIAYVGLAVIVYVAGKMIYEGFVDHNVGILTLFV
ncbi:YjbE family integral membrane protein [Sphingobium xenophagum]|uniref:YjbE family integral membrane protein n=1 Tax=Sphingobium xenophagum TaxID=121428 RepID=A0ABU1X2U7_SPHXE|nr:YjbE family putative metal transport protein [Sphingobium xenophagum]MDR7155878.1 YjbE family integral membrane protein [Sphingobium xenophagum]